MLFDVDSAPILPFKLILLLFCSLSLLCSFRPFFSAVSLKFACMLDYLLYEILFAVILLIILADETDSGNTLLYEAGSTFFLLLALFAETTLADLLLLSAI